MRRAVLSVLVSLVVLTGCSGPVDRGGSNPSPTPSSPGGGATGVPTEPGGGTVPTEPDPTAGGGGSGGGGSGGGRSGGGGTSEDERDLEVAGPTLDNTFPTNPFALPAVGGSSCVIFTNPRADVPVVVRSVRLVDQQPSDDPGLVLGSNPSGHGQCSPSHPSYPSELQTLQPSCTDAQLRPAKVTGCPVEVRSTGSAGTDYTAALVLRLSATCTALSGEPCLRLAGRREPTAADPVTVTWTETRRYTSCLAPHTRSGEFSDEEGQGRCPPVESASPPPGSDGDPGSDSEPGSGEPSPDDPPSTEGSDQEQDGTTAEQQQEEEPPGSSGTAPDAAPQGR